MRFSLPVLLAAAVMAQPHGTPQNLDFEQGTSGWFVPKFAKDNGFTAEPTQQGCKSGAQCVVISATPEAKLQAFGNIMQSVDATPFRGKTIRLEGWIRVEPGSSGRGQMWLRVDRPNRVMGFFDNMDSRPVTSPEWRRYRIEGDVDSDATSLNFGVMLTGGKGSVWVDGVSIETLAEAPAEEVAAARKALASLYARIEEAIGRNDATIYRELADPGVKFNFGLQAMSLNDLIEASKSSAGVKMTSRTAIESIRLVGDTATVVARTEGKRGAMDYIVTSRDRWRKTPEGWRLIDASMISRRTPLQLTKAETAAAVASLLQQKATPLSRATAGGDYTDLAAFGRAVGNARIVSLGEATHGTREFFQMKHRLLEYLVKEKGFTVFAIEANWPECLAIDQYIKTGEGDPKRALAGIYFWTWNTEEVLEMIEWMRAYNKAAGRPVLTFTGFDMQTARVAAARAATYLGQTLPAEYPAARKPLDEAATRDRNALAEKAATLAPELEKVIALFDQHRTAMIAASSAEAWRDARQAAVVAWQAVIVTQPKAGSGYRDEMMARNVEWLLNEVHPKEKIVLWAHNAHVGVAEAYSTKWMGQWLRERYPNDMFVLGFTFHKGSAQAIVTADGKPRGLQVHDVPPLPAGTGGAVLAQAGHPILFYDMRPAGDGALGQWLREPHTFIEFGAMWNSSDPQANARTKTLAQSYDAFIFFETTTAAKAIR